VIFSRRKGQPRDCGPGIAEFWRWWPQVRAQVEKSIGGGDWDDKFIREINKRVHAIHPDLQWEFGRGSRSKHDLVVCAPGDPALRAVVGRWQAAAPPADPTWAYHCTRQANPDFSNNTLTFDQHTVALQKMRFGVEVDTDRHEIDVTSFHPVFSVMTDDEQLRVTYLSLDWALGEADVEVWVGHVQANRTEPQRPHTAAQLRSAVANLAQKASDDRWAILTGERDGHSLMATVRAPLKPARWPRFDTHLRLDLRYQDSRPNGFPSDKALQALRAFEDRLIAAVSNDGALVAHETINGRRTLHLYIDGLTKAADTAKRLLPEWREAKPTLTTTYDPAWEAVSHLRP
jgi:Family of unknown function (DUF695)